MSSPTGAPATERAEAGPRRARSSAGEVKPRWAVREDLEAIAALDRVVFPEMPYPLFVLRQHLDARPQSIFQVIEADGVVCGYALASVVSSEQKAWLLGLAVSEDHRGLHYGDQLLSTVLDLCWSSGVQRVLITVRPNNEAALGLYKKHHFHRTSSEENYYGDREPREILQSDLDYDDSRPLGCSA